MSAKNRYSTSAAVVKKPWKITRPEIDFLGSFEDIFF